MILQTRRFELKLYRSFYLDALPDDVEVAFDEPLDDFAVPSFSRRQTSRRNRRHLVVEEVDGLFHAAGRPMMTWRVDR